MLTMQGISARKSAVAPVLAVVLALLCTLWPAPLRAWPQGGVPQAVWQDSERNNRRSPSQIKRQLRPPQVRAAQLPLADDAQDQRAAKTRGLIAANAAPLAAPPASGDQLPMLEQGEWRLKVAPAAVTNTDSVLLGDIAAPLGHMDPALWSDLKSRRLWPAPPEEGKPLQINRSRLSQALRQSLGNELAARCILPTSLVIQRGGLVFREDDLRSYVVKSLTPQLSAMPGEAELNEFRLPEYIFLAHSQQRVQLEPGKLTPGRVPLRFAVQEADGTVLRRVSGTVNLTLWITVPAASRPLGKGDALTPEAVTFMRINASQLRDLPWDGHGGPWQVTRSLITGEPILQSDLASQLMVRRGTILSLIYTRGNLRMTTQAEALADGEPGATIPVRNLQTKKQIYATVKDGSTVEIH
ncbi:flagellar basal body P-ring formation chaperone FlgA [Desulfovibrio fairfieldensis]|nr:flagellar basal body P-ring formation chaperone FlgA [Desulfovibrio fairfieldensis]